MVYGFVGWCWETPYVSIKQRKVVNRGFLNGPFIPIYAFGALFIIRSEAFLQLILPSNAMLQFLLVVLYASIMSSILEYVTSYVLEQAFHTKWWDYSDKKFNLNGRICLVYSIGWGFVGFSIIKWIHPVVQSLIAGISIKIGTMVLIIYCFMFIVDVILTLKDLISLKIIMSDLLALTGELKVKLVEGIHLQKGKLVENLEIRQVKIKEEILYRKAQGGAALSEKQEALFYLLEKSKKYSRFYHIFPKARSSKFHELVDVVRKNIKR